MIFSKTFFPVLLCGLSILLSGCGYHLGEIRPTTMRSVRTLAVPTFKNSTYLPRIEVLVADIVIRELQLDGTYSIEGSEQADAILNGSISKVDRRPIRSVTSNVLATSEYELLVFLNYTVQDRVTGVELLSGQVRGTSTFFPTGDLQTDERQAFSVAAQRAAAQLASRVTEGW